MVFTIWLDFSLQSSDFSLSIKSAWGNQGTKFLNNLLNDFTQVVIVEV